MWLASLGQLLLHHHVTAQINQRCSVLIPPENGQTSCQINSKGKEVCTISCNSGYHLEGSEGEHSCELGKWYPAVEEPKCIDSNAQDVGHHVQYSDQTDMDISTCQLWGGDIFKTFDGAMYRFPGKCNYKLFGDCATSAFSVNMDLSKNEIATVFGGQQVILRGENGTVNLYSGSFQLERTSIPSVISGLIVERMGDWTVLKSPDFVLRWDGADNILVIPSKTLATRSCGLCGNFDGMSDNDFTTIEHGDSTSPIVFGNSWRMPSIDGSCKDASFEKFCEYQTLEDTEYYRSECKKLASNSFSKCHEKINVEPWIEMCVESLCAGGDFCESAAAYFRECSAQGVALDWRSENMCQKSCPVGQVYRECVSGCPETCKAGAIECNDDCVSGCVCSEGLVLHDGECIKKTSCPCFSRGVEYNSGDSIKDVCNTCTCGEGKWTCTEDSCDGICKSTGVNHFETFDGSFYDFVGECAYSLVEPIQGSEENIWAVYLRYHDCEQHVKKLCKKSIEVRVGESYFTFEGDFKTLHDGHLIEHFPIQANGVQVTMASTYIQRIDLTEVGISVFWNGKDRVYVHAQASLRNSIHGLCGTFNDRTDDDLKLPDGTVQTSAVEFGNAWKALSICQDEFDDSNDLHPCDTYLQLRSSATGSCEALMSPAFSACHNVVAVESYYYRCTYDYCACAGVQMSMAGVCSAVEDYARSCAEAGVTVNWQQAVDEQCQPSCPGDMRYQQCGLNSATCESLSSTSLLLTDDSCAEGCYCPEGLFLDRDHLSCVAASDCTCAHGGKLYQPGATRAEGCQDCTCSNGAWTCETDEARCVDKTCPAGMEWTECVSGCEGTCANLHILDKHACESVECSPGCQCQKDFVRLGDECVAPSECPCFRGGKSYSENDVIETSCEKCTCGTSGHFECEAKPCWKQCSVFGDPHFTTFDGKSYKFQGSCKYVFARSQTNSTDLSINIENVPCGSSGVTCTRNLDVNWHGETISIDRETYLDTLKLPENCTAWTSGAVHFLQCSDVFVLKWDDQTTVSLLMNPRLSGAVEGLCGNMNGNQNDDFKTPGNGLIETSASIFGDSWKIFGYCPEATEVPDTCAQHPNRQNWAKKSCSVIKSSVFSSCHNIVPTKMFYDACVYDGCGCDSGGDCECTCTAIAAYASECARNGVVIDWRKPSLCPMQCGDCPLEYSACNDPCPKTCQNRHNFDEISRNCQAGSCAEGCACQDGKIWDQHAGDCVFEKDCTCGMFDGVVFMEGDLVPSAGNECENCFCTEGRLECIGSGCSTSSPVTTTTHASTTFTTTTDAVCCTKDDNEYAPGDIIKTIDCKIYKCSEDCEIILDSSACPNVTTTKSTTTIVTKSPMCVTDSNEWTEWMNYNIPTLANDGDFENHHFLRRRYEYCGEEMISAVECRPAGASTYSGQMVTCNVDTGLTCFNDNQEIGICLDYEVRFFCRCGVETTTESPTVAPTTVPTTETKTIVIATTTSVSTKPTTTSMPTKSTERPFPTKSTTTTMPTKSTPRSTKQTTSTPTQSSATKTLASTTVPVCDPLTPKSCEMGWSQWLKIDEVPLNCKYEICEAPTSVECRVWNKQVNKIAPCSLDVQTCEGCEDMYARFYCPCETTEAPKPTASPTTALPTTTTMISSTSIPDVCEIDMEKKLTKQVFSSSSIALTDSRIGYSGWMAGKAASGEFVTLIFQEPQVITGLKLQRIMGNLYPTSIRIYVKGSESKSQADVMIPEGEGLVFLDQPLIASEVSFLIMKWVGDMPSLKMSVLTSCDSATTTSTQTTTTVCTKGCALTCGDLCQKIFVEYTNMGLCKSAETCLRPTKCLENTLTCDVSQRFDGQRCVNYKECACLADDGTVIKPGQVLEGKECDQFCVDNKIELSCDSIVTRTTPAVTTSHTRTTEGKTIASTVSVTEGPITTTKSIRDQTETVTTTTVLPITKTIEEKTTDLITGKVYTTRTTVPTVSSSETVPVPISTDKFTEVPITDGTTVITDETTTTTVTVKPSGLTQPPIILIETTRRDGTTTTEKFTLTTKTHEDTTIRTVTLIEDCISDCDVVTQTTKGTTKTTEMRTSEGLKTETTTTDVTEDGTIKTTTTTTIPNEDDTTTITTTTTKTIDERTTEKLTSTTTATTEGTTTTEHIETTTIIPSKTSLTTLKQTTASPSITTSTTITTEGTPVSSTVSVTDGQTTRTKTISDQTETVTTTTVSPDTTKTEEKTTHLITGTVLTKTTTSPTESSTGKVTVPISTDKFTTVPVTGKTVIVDETTTITVTTKTTGATEKPIIHVETETTEGMKTTEEYTLTTEVSEDTTVQTLTTSTGGFVSQTTQTGASISTEIQTSEGIMTETTTTDVTENDITETTTTKLPNGDDTTIVTKTTTTIDGKTTEKYTTKTTTTSEGTTTTKHVETTTKIPSTTSSTPFKPTTTSPSVTTSTTRATDGTSLSSTVSVTQGPTTITKTAEGQTATIKTTTSPATTSYPTDSGPTTGACVDRIVNQMFTVGCDRCYCSDAGGLICKNISDCETTTTKSTTLPTSTSSSSTESTSTTEYMSTKPSSTGSSTGATKSFTTKTTTPEKTTITTIEIPESCLVWGEWQNNNFVSTGDDRETIKQYLENSNICAEVMDIQCRVADFLTPSDQTSDDTTCDIENGLKCTPSMSEDDFFGFGVCLDYEIRLYCIDARKEECLKPDPFIVTETTVIPSTTGSDNTSTKSPETTTKPLVVSTKTSETTPDGTMVTTFTEQPMTVSETFTTTGELISKTTKTIIDDTITTLRTETPTTISIKTMSSGGFTTRSTEEITSKSTGSTTTVMTESTTEDSTQTIKVPITEDITTDVPRTSKTTVSTPSSTSSIVTEPIDTTTTKVTIFSENTEATLIYSTGIDTTTGATIGTLTTEHGDIITETTEYFNTETSSVTETTRIIHPVTKKESTVSTTTLSSESTTTEAPTETSDLTTVPTSTSSTVSTTTSGDLTTEEITTTKVTEIPGHTTTTESFTDGTVKTTTVFTDGTEETTTTTPSVTTSKVQTTDGQTISSTVTITGSSTSKTTQADCHDSTECQKNTGTTTTISKTTLTDCLDSRECRMKTATTTTVSPTTTTIETTSTNLITGEISTTSTIAPTESITETVSVPISTGKTVTVPITGKTVITDSTGTISISTNPTAKVPTVHVETTTSAGSTTSKMFTLTTTVSEDTTTKTLATVTGEIVTEKTRSGATETTKTLTSEGFVTETTTTDVTDDFTKKTTTTTLPNRDDTVVTSVVTTTSTRPIDDKTTREVKTQTTITPDGSTTSEYVTTTTTIPSRTSTSATKGNVTTMKSTTESEEITETTVFNETTSEKTTTTIKTTKATDGTISSTTTKKTTSSPTRSSTESITETMTPDGHVETSTASSTTMSSPDGTTTEILTTKIINDDDNESTTTTTTTRKTTPGKETATVIYSDGTTVVTERTTSVPIPTDSSETTTASTRTTTSIPNHDDTEASTTSTTTKKPSTTTAPIFYGTTKHPVFTSSTVEPSLPSSTTHSSTEGPYSTTKSMPIVSTSSTVTESGSTISTETTVTDGTSTTTKLMTETSEEITTTSITESTISTEKVTTDLITGKTVKTTTTAPMSSTKSVSVPITSSTVPDATVLTEGITVIYDEETTTTITTTPSSTEDIHITVTTQKTTEGSTEEPLTKEYVFTTLSTDQSTTELLTTVTGALITKTEKTDSTVTSTTTSEEGTIVTNTTTKLTPTEEIKTSTTTYPSGQTETTTTSTAITDETTTTTMITKTMGDSTTSTSYVTKSTPPTTLPTEVTRTGTSSTVTIKMPSTDMTSEMTSIIASTVSEHLTKTSPVPTSKSSESSSTIYPEETTLTSKNTQSTASPITHKETSTILVTGSYSETTTSGGKTTSSTSSTLSSDGTTVSTTTVTEETESTTETSTTDGIITSTTETVNTITGETTVTSTMRPESTVETITIPYEKTTLSVPTEGTVSITTDDYTKTTLVTTKPIDKSTISIVITTDSTEGTTTTKLTETTTVTETGVTKEITTPEGTVVSSSTLTSTAGSTKETSIVTTTRGPEKTESVTSKIPNGTTKITTTVSPTGEITKTETITKSTSPTSSETTTTTTTPDKKTNTSTTKTTAIPTRTSVVTTSPDGTVTSTVTEHTIAPITKVELTTAPMVKTTSKIIQTTTMVLSTKPTITTTTDEELTTLIQSTIATHMSTKSAQSTRSPTTSTTTTSPGGYCITDEGDIIPEGEQTIDNTECVIKSCDKLGEFVEMKVPAKECLISATGSVSTFDEFVYDSKSCTGISVNTCDSDDLTIKLVPSESILFKLENLWILLEDNFKSLLVDGVEFEMTALDALNEVLFQKAGVRLLDLDEEFVIFSPLVRISISTAVVKIRAEPDMFGKLCGGCGNADCKSTNDQIDEPTSNETDDENCAGPICEQPMEDLDQICEYISDEKFSTCITNSTAQLDFCKKSACECLSSGDSVESCRCKIIAAAMNTCQLQTDSCINWRSQYGCTMPECAGNKIWRDCGSTCVRTCAHILDKQDSCEDEVFQPGCYCPPGTVFKGGQCVDERECKCTCKGWGDPHYQTFDKTYYAFQGNCSYVLAQDENKDFTVIGHNEYCLESPTNTCTKAVTLRYKGHEVTLVHGLSFIIDEVTKTVLEEDTILGGNIAIKLVRGRFILIEVEQISLKIMYDEMTRGFAISIPILVYHDKVGGLCGNCNLDGSDDFIDITGEVHFVPITFAKTWKLEEISCDDEVYTTRPPTMSTPHNPGNCTSECEILMDDVFSSCRKVVDVSPFLSSCVYDACNNLPNASCYAIGAYADECRKSGICVNWREEKTECPFTCEDQLEYNHCANTCDKNECDSDISKNCEIVEECTCPDGLVLENSECIKPEDCLVCLGEFKDGEKWRNATDPCTEHICIDGIVEDHKETCHTEVRCVADGMVALEIPVDGECCSDYECQCDRSTCPEKPTCAEDEYLVVIPGMTCCDSYTCQPRSCSVATTVDFLQVEECVSLEKQNLTTCAGYCASTTELMETFNGTEKMKSCTCCSAVESTKKQVDLMCPGGVRVRYEHEEITLCSCNASQCSDEN